MKTIFIVMDSLNRHYLNAYGDSWVKTPNLDRLAEKSTVFDCHYSGSLPCMPARREMMTGRLNFLEAPWGPIEPWDDCLPVELRKQNKTYTHMITDHYHYFHSGGEAYHTLFDSWEFLRGQEGDLWHPLVKEPEIPKFKGKNRRAYWVNREFMASEKDEAYPTPQCFMQAMSFVDHNHEQDNWHLHLEVFDPHEPFACPKKYRDLYDDQWDEAYHFNWPSYGPIDDVDGEVEHIRKSYAGTLTMADYWLGKLLDKLDAYDMWEDTAVILTTDHGHLLGEHGYWAKNYMFDYQELVHIPLFMYVPGGKNNGTRVKSLTTTIDLMPTLMALHHATLPEGVQGKSLMHLAYHEEEAHHDAVLYGYFGKDVNMYNGRYTYCRQPMDGSVLHHYTAMPRGFSDFLDRDKLKESEVGVFLNHTHGIPHFKLTHASYQHMHAPNHHLIYDIKDDPKQQKPIHDEALEQKLAMEMTHLLERYDAPDCQYDRLGLSR